MNYIDILLLLVMFISIWAATQRGFILAALALVSWVGSLAISFAVYKPFGALLQRLVPSLSVWGAILSFIIVVIISRMILDTIAERIIEKVPDRVHTSIPNRVLAVIPGAINGFIWVLFIATFLLLLPVANNISKKAHESKLASSLVSNIGWFEDKLADVFKDTNRSVIIEDDPHKAIKLPHSVSNPETRTDLEAEMLVMVNKERTDKGLKPLKADPEMAVVARKHSVDMFARGYFSHYTPEGADPFDRMKQGNVRFLTAGENLAVAQTLSIAHTGLMHSPGHRANILNPSFGRVGIGIVDGGIYGIMITQDFRN